MSSYISSIQNRFYVALETSYAQAAAISSSNRIPAVDLHAKQVISKIKRRDKTGSRTFQGWPPGAKRETAFQLRTYMTSWAGTGEPPYGPLLRAALGATPTLSAGLQVQSSPAPGQVKTITAHGLEIGNAVASAADIRFVTSVIDSTTMQLNAPFSNTPVQNDTLAPAITYKLATALPSLSIYDYWDPVTAISRLITGAAVNQLQLTINGDFHEFTFGGPACDILDSQNMAAGTSGLAAFPAEPSLASFDYSIVPGNLGQVWLGSTPGQFFSLTAADVLITNHIDARASEYGSSYPRAVCPGPREVSVDFSLLAQDDAQSNALYAAAKLRTPVPALLQLGQQQGSLMGIYVPGVVPELPLFDDSATRLQWHFKNCSAQGVANDEIYIAFA